MEKAELTKKIKDCALELGFDKVGIARAELLPDKNLREWLRKKYHGQMGYMANYFNERLNPKKLVKNALSIISVAKNYYTDYPTNTNPQEGRFSRYAWGDDYHDIIRPRLKNLLSEIQKLAPDVLGRTFIDTAPIMDKQWAVKAGLGWQGKHSNVITKEFGSWLFLGEVVIDRELDYDESISDYCGSCTRCIEACPTNAIVGPYVVDASRCISYLTIELKSEHNIPEDLASSMENHVFGCDICQDVCPWNIKFAKATSEKSFLPRINNNKLRLVDMAEMPEDEFKLRFRQSPIKRPKYKGFMRNVHNALKNYSHGSE